VIGIVGESLLHQAVNTFTARVAHIGDAFAYICYHLQDIVHLPIPFSFASLGDNIIYYLDYITSVSFSQIDLPSLKNALMLFFKSRMDFHDADIGEKEQSWADETLGLGAI